MQATLTDGQHTITLTATDSGTLTDAKVVHVTVGETGNSAPVAAISSPSEGVTLESPVTLEGSATDAEDGDLPGEALSWSSSVDGNLGTGASLQTALTNGEHTITLTATDSGNAVDTEVVHITVQSANTAPEVIISTPAENNIVQNPVTFTGTATDAEDGALTGAWKEGETVLGSGNNLVKKLSPGQHTVTFTATDSQNSDSSASVTFYVWTCHATLDHDDNGIDIGDFVVLLEQFAGESLSCINPQSGCIAELDRNGNGLVDIGDFISLLTLFSQGSIQDVNGQTCQV
ncbi:Uncharacterised protein [uncultured archaeon]|nr:Uncharacterised protein [uncultured archaeon]